MSEYLKLSIDCPDDLTEIIMAELEMEEIEVFEETATGTACYIKQDNFTLELSDLISEKLALRNLKYIVEEVPDQNWNEAWESNFQPVSVEHFAGVRASFHPENKEVKYDLVINPKMAFGTGHHETTWLVMEMMKDLRVSGKKVLDFGCGTGILGILALKMGADSVIGNDISEEAIINTIENCTLNEVKPIDVRKGGIEVIPEFGFDIILANITRNVIVDSLAILYSKLVNGGILITSGYLKQDQEMIEKSLIDEGFKIVKFSEKGNWLCHYSMNS